MKTILASAYAINPYKGSEDGMGWNFVMQIARFNKVVAITRKNNETHINNYMREHPHSDYANIHFVYYDLPYWMRFWKKGGRGAMIYYYMWQLGLPLKIWRTELKFDIVHNLNFHNDWTPSFLWLFKKPFVWGPIGHHPVIPPQFLKKYYGRKSLIKNKINWITKKLFWSFDPFLKITKHRAQAIFAMNTSVSEVLRINRNKFKIMPSVASEQIRPHESVEKNRFEILSVGRFVALKGFDVTINAFAAFLRGLNESEKQDVKLTLIGKGPALGLLNKLIKEHEIADYVEIINWVDRDKLESYYRSSSAYLFPSHEGAGMVVSEALSYGLPVLCFDNCGPGEFVDNNCGFKTSYLDYESSVNDFANNLSKLYVDRELLNVMSRNAITYHEQHFSWNVRGELLKQTYDELSASVADRYSREYKPTTVLINNKS